jgi:hypothetical protein
MRTIQQIKYRRSKYVPLPLEKRSQHFVLLTVLVCASTTFSQVSTNSFEFHQRTLNLPIRLAGDSFVGQSDGRLIIGGGRSDNQVNTDVFVGVPPDAFAWLKFELKTPVSWAGYVSGTLQEEGVSVTKLFVVGGRGTNGIVKTVQVLEWRKDKLVQSELPPLPIALCEPGVGFFEDQPQKQLYVVGGVTADAKVSRRVFRYSFKGSAPAWEELLPMPGEGRASPGVLCFYNDVHVFGGTTPGGKNTATALAYRWKVIDGTTFTGWRELAPMPVALCSPLVFQTGQVHAMVAGGHSCNDDSNPILVYHNVTDTWINKGSLPQSLSCGAVLKLDGKQILIGSECSRSEKTAFYMTVRRTAEKDDSDSSTLVQ